jgi:hypothetical protein
MLAPGISHVRMPGESYEDAEAEDSQACAGRQAL